MEHCSFWAHIKLAVRDLWQMSLILAKITTTSDWLWLRKEYFHIPTSIREPNSTRKLFQLNLEKRRLRLFTMSTRLLEVRSQSGFSVYWIKEKMVITILKTQHCQWRCLFHSLKKLILTHFSLKAVLSCAKEYIMMTVYIFSIFNNLLFMQESPSFSK